jgi:hypothetical protein
MARDVYDALWDRWRQLLFTDTEAAEDMQARIAALQRAGDREAALRYAREVCPWLDPAARRPAPLPAPPPPEPAEPRRPWAPPAAPGIPAPTPAHAAVAARIIRGDRRLQE